MIDMEISRQIIFEGRDGQLIFLKEKEGDRTFPIVIGIFEAVEINRKLKEVGTPRPMTHDLLGSTLRSLGGELLNVVVNELKNNTFFARLVIRRLDGAVVEVDSRASDALALSIQFKVPILVADQVVDKATESM
jgi:uncharacterized protein